MKNDEEEQETINIEDLPPEDRKKILAKALTYVETKNIARKQKKSAKERKKKRKADSANHFKRLHRPGAHWFSLSAYFDPATMDITPIEDSGYMLGVLEDFVVVEVPEDMTQHGIAQIGQQLGAMNLKVLIVKKGVKFLRLEACDANKERELNDISAKQEAERNEKPEATDNDTSH